MLAPGQKLFDYDIIRPLGQGGFAAVYEARHRVLGRQVAIKQLLLKKTSDKTAIKRFIQEARIAASLEHPNVVTIYNLQSEGQNFYMIMEYMDGGSLADLLQKKGKLSPEEAVQLTIGICEGLAQFHSHGIIHRDIKMDNILLTADGRPKVIDFGIAHVPEAMGGLGLTQEGFQPSTLLYSSPEQMRGELLDPRSDVYQIGELLYFMLVGTHYINLAELENQISKDSTGQFKGFRSQFKLYELLEEAICEVKPVGLKQLWREVGALAGVVENALAKDRIHRFKNAAEFAATLKTVNIGEVIFSTNVGSANLPITDLPLQNSRAYNKRGQAHASTRNYEQAIIDYTKAIQLDSKYAEAYNNRSAAHLQMKNYGQAVVDCYWAIELAPDFVAGYVNRGIAYTGMRDYPRAVDDYNEALTLDPGNVYALYNRGNTYLWQGQYQMAITDFSQVIAKNPEFVAAFVNRGVAHLQLQFHDLALADFSEAIDLNPDYLHAYYNRATLYREMQQYEYAIADYSKVIELNPEHRYAFENRADSFSAIGNEERAEEDYTHMIAQTSVLQPKRLSVAQSMLMPTTPLELLTEG